MVSWNPFLKKIGGLLRLVYTIMFDTPITNFPILMSPNVIIYLL